MKHLLLLSHLLLALFSCGSSDNENHEGHSVSSNDTNESIENEKSNVYLPEDPIERDFGIAEMPKRWWLLSEKDGMLLIIDHWDAQIEIIEFYEIDAGSWMLDIYYAHDTEQGTVSDFHATILEGDGISKVEGSFTYGGYFQDEPREITFFWDQLRYHAEFKNLLYEPAQYVPDESKDFFPFEETFREED